MRNALKNLPEILRKVSQHGCVLMLDFDGTLSPIVRHPKDAALSNRTRNVLKAAAKRCPVAIISGRTLRDIRQRIGIPGIVYAGSHGYEWQIATHHYRHIVPDRTMRIFREAKHSLLQQSHEYPQLIREEKSHSVAMNYRALSPKHARRFRRNALRAMIPYLKRGLRIMDSLRTFEIVADSKWSKGRCVLLLYKELSRRKKHRMIPIYIGDGATDEDAFKALTGGITVRVGKNKTSAAHYYIQRRKEVDAFIVALSAGVSASVPRGSRSRYRSRENTPDRRD